MTELVLPNYAGDIDPLSSVRKAAAKDRDLYERGRKFHIPL